MKYYVKLILLLLPVTAFSMAQVFEGIPDLRDAQARNNSSNGIELSLPIQVVATA